MASRDCQVCLEPYDEEERKPRCLSCGHTLCNSCIADCLSRGPLLCPFCRLVHAAPVTRASDVPVNYTVINLLQDTSYSLVSQRAETLLAEVKKEANEFTTSQLVTCNCRLTRLHDFQQRLNEQCSVHRVHVQALRSLVERHEGLLQDMTSRSEQAAATITEGKEIKSRLESAQAKVNGATNLLEVTAAHEEDRCYRNTVTEWDAAAHRLLQSQVVAAARELEFVTAAALQAVVERSMSAATAAVTPTKAIQPPVLQEEVTEPGDTSQLVLEMVKQARLVGSSVWATTTKSGRPRRARVDQQGDHLFLSALQEGEPPLYSHTLPYEKVRSMVDEDHLKVFLELSWGGQVQGRVNIKLTNATTRTRHFFYLCTGELGPSYGGTYLLEVENRGQPGERVWGGDYQANNGTGGAAMKGFTMGELTAQPVTAGLVASFCYGSDDHRKPSHFVVYTSDYPVTYEECPVGRVDQGLDLFRFAAKVTNVRDAIITDCGLVLSV
ncbi:uncharacterized protein LOC123509362 [Portunus trituberculatus]|uniref:uncharacterized protein LOC123509362 n=1 Tax=Portunus trituberculatus TaxID=210409 RepID=UPI001E1CC116|nr:uncharacterized protein LOC123509362 [Portunus trituberculatus]